MKSGHLFFCFVTLLLCSSCAVVRWTTSFTRDYDYWGHLALGAVQAADGEIVIPIEHDPMDGELWMDSGQTYRDVPVTVEGEWIYFNIRTCLASATGTANPLQIRVRNLQPGTYRVAYRDGERLVHPLGTIEIQP